MRARPVFTAFVSLVYIATLRGQQKPEPTPGQEGFRFKTGVELISVAASVSDSRGRFVSGLRKDDFVVYEDDVRQAITHFSADRVPVSLGMVIDTSGSMSGEKIEAARGALGRFIYELLDDRDEVFLYRFSDAPVLLQGWTTDRRMLSRALGELKAGGGTAMYDAVAEAVPMASHGRHAKKALVVISDGNDTSSRIGIRDLRTVIRQSEVLVYAVGIDGEGEVRTRTTPAWPPPPRRPIPGPIPFPGGGPRRGGPGPWLPGERLQVFGGPRQTAGDDRVNVAALRDMTDDSGGRTEIVRWGRDLGPATASIADELSKQYDLGYTSTLPRDGRWHTIRVELREGAYRVRARRGYLAN
jgi:VWFA-related protein